MTKNHDYCSDINPSKDKWNIVVRVIRLWYVPSFNNANECHSIDMVLMDEKGGKIQASIKRSLVVKFRPLLYEGESYTISDFGVGQNSGEYKPTAYAYKINFLLSTKVDVAMNVDIPTYGFEFASFEDIISNRLDDKCLVDVIGNVSGVTSVGEYIRNGKSEKKVIIELQDLQKNTLSCTLWNRNAEQLRDYLSEHPNCTLFLIIRFAKIKPWQGVIGLSSSLFATQLLINSNIQEVDEYRNSFGNGAKTTSDIVTQISTQISQSIADEFLKSSERKHIDEIRETQEVCTCITLATINSIQNEYGWCYNACKKDFKKVQEMITDDVTKFWCEKCNTYVDPIPRFKVQIRVVDDSGSATFVLFDREVVQILGKSAIYMRENKIKDGSNDESIPEDLINALLGRKFLFKIKVTDYNLKQNWPTYTVMKISEDEKLIKAFVDTDNSLQETVANGNDNGSEICSSSCITPTPKRSFEDLENASLEGNLTSTEFSTNKAKRKIVVKEEKD